MRDNYLHSIKQQFEYYKMLGNRTFEPLTEEQLSWQYNEESNSIATVINHMWGNMKSRWTDFFISDGEKEWRDRDGEFEPSNVSKTVLLERWDNGWDCLFDALDSITEDNFEQIVYIRNQGHTVTEAINRQLAHYAYHVGQIVFLGKMIQDSEWKSLSIPKKASEAYNKEKFSQEKHREHFTKEFLNSGDESSN